MAENQRRWIIRDAAGHIDGPFTTEKVLYKIGRGEFSGEEHISHYPEGKWIPISQDPQFYDKLLEVLASDEDSERSEVTHILEFTRQETTEPPTSVGRRPSIEEPEDQTSSARHVGGANQEFDFSTQAPEDTFTTTPSTSGKAPSGEGPPLEEKAKKKKRKKRRRRPEDIELVDSRPELVQQLFQRAKLPIFVLVAGLLIGFLFMVTKKKVDDEDRIHLIAPQKNVAQVDPEKLRSRVQQGAAEFLKDTYEGYLQAQNSFVSVIEQNNKNREVLALLCMTYLQLWPYSYQDSSDSKVISTVVQLSSQIDPGGMHSANCRAVDLIVRSRIQEAKSMVEAILDSRANNTSPPIMFYFLKGYLLEVTGDHASAVGYLQSAQQLWPTWTLPYAVEAQSQAKLERHGPAANLYRRILKANPAHTVSRIELGLLEYKNFNHPLDGERLLKEALASEGAPRSTRSRGYQGLAEIALQRGNQKLALDYAQKAFSLNPTNAVAKNLIVQIGGVDKLKTTKVKAQQLVYEGDQYFREGDYHAAQAHYKAAFEEDPRNALPAIKAAQCLWRMSFSTEAIEWLNRAIKADPKLIEAYVLMADYQSERYNFMAATRVLETARQVNPKSYEVFRGFAMIELRRNNAKGSITFGKEALKIYDNDVETQIILAEASLLLRDPKMAYNYSSKAVDLDGNHRKAQVVFAKSLAGLQGVDVGVDYLLKLVNLYPLVSEYRLALGKMLLEDERYQQAEEIFRQIINLEKDGKPKEALVELARVLKAQGNMGEALDLLLKAAVLDPADAEPLYLAGLIYLDLKKPQEAAVQFQRVLTINKLFPLVYFQLGRAAMQSNDPKAALSFTEAEKRANPNLADAYLLAAEAQTLLQQYSLCASEYQKAIKLRPQQANIYIKIATCYRKSGNLDAAMSMLAVAGTKESGLADIYKEQGAIYEQKGDVIKAVEAYNQYFVLDPDAPDRAQIEARISALQRGQSP